MSDVRVIVPVLKASSRQPTKRQALRKIFEDSTDILEADLKSRILLFRKKINFHKVLEELEKGNWKKVEKMLPWDKYPDVFKYLDKKYFEGISASGTKSREFFNRSISQIMPVVVKPLMRFDEKNPRIKKWINQNTGALIKDISENSREAIADTMKQGFRVARTPLEISDEIRHVGLHPRQMKAAINYRSSQVDNYLDLGYSTSIARRKARDDFYTYSDRALTSRTKTIARTEMHRAINTGQREMWQQALDQKILDPSIEKEWVATMDIKTCPDCVAINGKRIKINEKWLLADGTKSDIAQMHPNCRCDEVLIFE